MGGLARSAGSDGVYGIGIPPTFTKQTSNSRTFFVQPGQLNHYRLRPAIINEHVETARQIQSVISSGNNVGQIFKASQDNINGVTLTLEAAQSFIVDDFESYANDAALQTDWVANTARLATIDTIDPGEGLQSMELPGSGAISDEWVTTVVAADLTGATGSLLMKQSHSYSQLKLRFFIGDGTNTKSAPIVVQDTNVWERIEISEAQLAEDGGGTTDPAAITKIGFRVEDPRAQGVFYLDDLKAAPAPGSVDLELWDMGTTIPETGVTALDVGTQYDELGDKGMNSGSVASSVRLDLLGGKRQYLVRPFIAGPALEIPGNTLLNTGNYYALVIKHVDKDINVYGANTSFSENYYQNGYAFTFPDNSTAIAAIGEYNDIQFGIFSTHDVYVNTFLKFFDAAPGSASTEFVYIEDKNMEVVDIIFNDAPSEQVREIEFKDRTMFLPKGGKFEVNHNDDFTDSVTLANVLIGYMYEPQAVNG